MLWRILIISRIALALAGAFAFGAVGYLAWQARPALVRVNGVLARAEGLETKINATAINLDKATATWADASKTQSAQVKAIGDETRGVLEQLKGAAADARVTLKKANAQIEQVGPLLSSARVAVDTLPPAVDELRRTVKGLQPTEDGATQVLRDLHVASSSPEVSAALHNLNVTSASAAHIAAVTDKRWSLLLDPPPCVGRYCWLKRSWTDLQTLTTFAGHAAPAAYWFEQFAQSIH